MNKIQKFDKITWNTDCKYGITFKMMASWKVILSFLQLLLTISMSNPKHCLNQNQLQLHFNIVQYTCKKKLRDLNMNKIEKFDKITWNTDCRYGITSKTTIVSRKMPIFWLANLDPIIKCIQIALRETMSYTCLMSTSLYTIFL